MEKRNIQIFPEKCTECYCCQLRCSLVYTGKFNPEKARIVLSPPYSIKFTEECVDGCSLCAGYCPQGALVKKKYKV